MLYGIVRGFQDFRVSDEQKKDRAECDPTSSREKIQCGRAGERGRARLGRGEPEEYTDAAREAVLVVAEQVRPGGQRGSRAGVAGESGKKECYGERAR